MSKKWIYSGMDSQYEPLKEMAMKIWEYAEPAHHEVKSSALQKEYLEKHGFAIREVPNMPTAFIAEYGSGTPVIGLLGEYDALPGLSQKIQTVQEPVTAGGNGHGCAHNLLGTGCVGAAVAVKEAMEREGLTGTIRYYGCPAEELLIGKPLMAKEGVFDDLDAALSWHPANHNEVLNFSSLAVNSIKFKFKGISAHAAMAPHLGRSALDAVEIMNVSTNYLREHVEDSVRMHYVITNGGAVPNAVPADAEVWYMIRAPKRAQVEEVTKRVLKAAEGAAHITETSMTYEVLSGCYDMIINRDLYQVYNKNLHEIGGPKFTEEDHAIAKELVNQIPESVRESVMSSYYVKPEQWKGQALVETVVSNDNWDKVMPGTFDLGDVSNIVPFAYMFMTAIPVGVSGHTWPATAAAGMEMGVRSLICAGKVMAGTAYDLMKTPALVERAKESFKKDTKGKAYVSPFD